MGVSVLVLLVLAALAVYVGTIEAAFSALMRLSLRLTAERGRASGLGRYLDDPVLLFVPVRLLMGLIVTVATVLVANLLGPGKGLGITVLCMAAFVAVFEHLLPLLIVRRDPETVLDWLLPSFNPVARAIDPITRSLVGIIATLRPQRAAAAAQPEGQAGPDEEEDEEATHTFLEAGEHEGLIEREERALLQSIVDFGDTLVREVMTPRPDIVAIRADATLGELRALLNEEEYSRIPVYRDNLDHILGFVHVKDLIRLGDVPLEERVVPRLLRPAYVIPETKRVAELLKEFQRQQVQSAIVVDEYGGTAGLVTIEDLLEEIVGEIRDEFDVETEPITEEAEGVFIVSGKVDIDEIAERLHVTIERDGFETVGGLLLTHVGRVPAPGEAFDIGGVHIEVLEAERRRVTKVRMRRIEQPEQAPGSDAPAGDVSGASEMGLRK